MKLSTLYIPQTLNNTAMYLSLAIYTAIIPFILTYSERDSSCTYAISTCRLFCSIW